MGQRGDFIMSEGCDAMSNRRLSQLMRLFRVLECLAGVLMSSEMFRLSLLFTGAMSVGGEIVQFGGSLVIFAI